MKNLKRYFLAGLVSLLPLGVTAFIIYFLVDTLGPILGSLLHFLPAMRHLPQVAYSVIGFVLLLIAILLIGMLATGFAGTWLLRLTSEFFSRLPLLRTVYGTARQLTDAVLVDRKSLKKVIALEYPRRGMYSIGFLMSETPVSFANGKKCVFVFLPVTPTPTSGQVHLVPVEEILETDLGVDEALKVFVSGGAVMPESLRNRPPPGSA
jgi:uncharacterized membrane protein